jgi:ATP-binding protein involved in chromosome partitioning
MAVGREQILKALSTVEDPDLKQGLVALKMVKDIEISDDLIKVVVELTTPACPLKEMIRNECEAAIKKEVGEEIKIVIDITSNVTTVREKEPVLPGVKNIVAVASGKGGVGKSTITANLAIGLAKTGASVGILDADIFGPSIPTMFNCEYKQPKTQVDGPKTIIEPINQYGIKLMSIGFMLPQNNAMVWRGPMAGSALKQLITDTNWGDLDYLLIDLPPGTSDIHLTMVQSIPVTGAIIVTTPQKIALIDAEKGLMMFNQQKINVPIIGLVENMAFMLNDSQEKQYVFGKDGGKKLAKKVDVELLGEVPLTPSICEDGDEGFPSVMKDSTISDIFIDLAKSVGRQIAIRNATQPSSQVVEITQH